MQAVLPFWHRATVAQLVALYGQGQPKNDEERMQDPHKIADEMVPQRTHFHLDDELTEGTGLSWQWWKKKIDGGHVRVFQQAAKRSGSRIVIPRSEIVRVLAEMVR